MIKLDYTKFLENKGKKRLLVLTGAGLSVESGIAPFRLDDGLWDNVKINDVCNIASLHHKYHLIHTFYNTQRVSLADKVPNEMHNYIVQLQKQYGDNFFHITSNIDDMTERAGGTAMHLHGNLTEVIENFSLSESDYKVIDCGYEPYIPKDGVFAKPNVVMIGEFYRYENGERKEVYADRNEVLSSLTDDDTVVIIGSSDTILKWSMMVGLGTPAYTVNINIRKNENDWTFNTKIYKPATKAIPELQAIIDERMK